MEIITHKEISSRGGTNFWKDKTPEQRSKIWKERAKKRALRKISTDTLA